MPAKPSFEPRKFLDHPGLFGKVEDVTTWRLAGDLQEAVLLARATEQHALAYVVHLYLLKNDRSIRDFATHLNQRREGLQAKLIGKVPAQEGDLIIWSWMTGEKRRTPMLAGLMREGVAVPSLRPLVRARDQ